MTGRQGAPLLGVTPTEPAALYAQSVASCATTRVFRAQSILEISRSTAARRNGGAPRHPAGILAAACGQASRLLADDGGRLVRQGNQPDELMRVVELTDRMA